MNTDQTAKVEQINMLIITSDIIRSNLILYKAKPLTKKQMTVIFNLMDQREQRWQLKGYQDGKRAVQPLVEKQQLRIDLSISLQKLADSNAQLGTCLQRAIESICK